MEEQITQTVEQDNEELNAQPQEQPKKKGHGCLIAFLIFIFLILGLLGAAYWGYKTITNGLVKQIDLKVAYTHQDFVDGMKQSGLTVDDPLQLCLDCTYPTFSKPKELEVTVTNAQASAWVDYVNQNLSYGKLENTQIKFTNNKAEISTLFTFQGKTFPVYAFGNISKATSTSINADLQDVKVGGLSLPSNITGMVQTVLVNLANEKLGAMGDTLDIEEIGLTNSGLHFKGLFPTKGE
ncbi:hypothetical protein KKA50_01285 [Patescibacteria group bacterium]|nr:hypothetical protein [Patescibacteria group bacterium]